MSDEQQVDAALEQPADDQTVSQESDTGAAGKDWEAEANKWKALARKHETTAKSNSDAAKRLSEIEESKKTAEQKLNDQLAAAQVELAEYKVREVRLSAIAAVGLDADMAQFITASDAEGATEQAKALAKRLKAAEPKADYAQGSRQTAQKPNDPDAWLRDMARR